MIKNLIILMCWLLCSFSIFAQNPKFDRLEMWFAQGHYQKVYKQSNKLLNLPEYDYSMIPAYYKSISLIQLCQNEFWLKKHPEAINKSKELFGDVRKSADGDQLFAAHINELSWLKNDMMSWAEDLKLRNDNNNFKKVQQLMDYIFENIELKELSNEVVETSTDTTEIEIDISNVRGQIVASAKKQLGVPYVWAGSSPDGFDCSGFTSYIMSQIGQDLPRRASDQYESSTQLKEKNVQPGDLIFFNNGSGISHVGIVVSKQGDPLVMIHSSSSKGIILTNVSESEYWTKRLHGYGTYVK